STYYALNELANFRMPNLGEQLNQFKDGVLFTGLFMGGAKALETAAPWIKKGASKVMHNIEKNVNKFGKYIDDLVPSKAVTPDGQIVYIKNDPMKSGGGGKKVELNKQQKEYNKAVEEIKNAKGDKVVGNTDTLLKGIDRGKPETYYSYTDLKKLIKKSGLSGNGKGLEAHHLLEKQFADVLGVNKNDIISVSLTPQWHRNVNSAMGNNIDNLINSKLDSILTNTGKSSAGVQEIWEAHRDVYEKIGQSDWANAIYEGYVKKFNVPYK
ncbi:hypothetical protein, partial [Clostridium estertheticum]